MGTGVSPKRIDTGNIGYRLSYFFISKLPSAAESIQLKRNEEVRVLYTVELLSEPARDGSDEKMKKFTFSDLSN